ncbi:PepSY domain-containing protein [Bradyrhizobium sp. BRP22]|uniref:PepSY-associated TM helix domain-containing protein n=1 Tax=Bradyrhizobium sp. BRP22 TaxID=2793821 RepID=UPI001CD6EBC5|nr:PepSY-associated TM helix domain-containing protein [Bradyrhizobium sp. BRP22]MCA1452214.1 PepSY domain-containing protein [Bradyrhizobium sp. BRP22]
MARPQTIRLWSRIHTWTSLISMVFLLMLCVTGLPLVFHDEIDELLEEEIAAPEMPADTPRASLDRAIEVAKQRYPGQFVLLANLKQTEPLVTVAMSPTAIPAPGQFHRVTIDARTAEVLGEETPHQDVMDIVLRIHKDMFTGLPGELFLGVMGLVFVVSLISGIIVYWPFMRRLDFGTIRRGSSPRLKWLDTHNLLGIVTVTWAVVVGITGTINTLATPLFDLWRAQLVPVLLAPYQGKPVAPIPSVQSAVSRVREKFPDRLVTSVTMPTSARFGSPQHVIVWTKGATPFTARMLQPVLVDANNGENIIAPQVPWYLRALQVSRPLHFGDYGGLPLKIVWALLDLVTIIVLGSGIYLWIAKRRTAPARTKLPRVRHAVESKI